MKKYRSKNKIEIGHLCQLVCDNYYLQDNINFAINYFSKSSIKNFTMWKMNYESLFLKQLGFEKIISPNRKFIYKSKKYYNKLKWNLSLSYSDVY